MISSLTDSPRPEWVAPLLDLAKNAYNHENNLWNLSQTIDIKCLSTLIDSGVIIIKEDELKFPDKSQECAVLSVYVVENLLIPEWDNPQTFGEALRQVHLSHASQRHKELGKQSLVLLHNIYGNNIVRRIADETKEGSIFPNLYASFIEALPYLNVDMTLIHALTQIQKATQHDLLNGLLYTAVTELCRKQKTTAESLFSALLEYADRPVAAFLPNVICGLSNHDFENAYDRCRSLCHSGNKTIKKYGLLGISNLEYSSHPDKIPLTINEFDQHLTDSYLADALVLCYGQFIALPEATCALAKLSLLDDQNTKYYLSRILIKNSKERCEEPWFAKVLLNLSSVTPQQNSTLNNIDCVLYDIVMKRPLLVRDFLEAYSTTLGKIDSHNKMPSIFKSIFELLSHDLYSTFQDFITRWFNSDNTEYHKMAADCIHNITIKNDKRLVSLSLSELSKMSSKDVVFTITKILGYVLDGKSLCFLIFSCLRKKPVDEVIYKMVLHIFVDYLGYNYPCATNNFLKDKTISSDPIEAQVATEVLAKISSYYEQRRKMVLLEELKPPADRVRSFDKLRGQAFTWAINDSNNKSEIINLFTRIPLKAGISFFSEYEGIMTEPSFLSEHSCEIEMPRSITIDPLGFEYNRLKWRLEKRDK